MLSLVKIKILLSLFLRIFIYLDKYFHVRLLKSKSFFFKVFKFNYFLLDYLLASSKEYYLFVIIQNFKVFLSFIKGFF